VAGGDGNGGRQMPVPWADDVGPPGGHQCSGNASRWLLGGRASSAAERGRVEAATGDSVAKERPARWRSLNTDGASGVKGQQHQGAGGGNVERGET